MSPDVPYFEDGTTRILRYLKAGLGDSFKAYMEGDPVAIPESLLPCICVVKLSGDTQPDATGTNIINESILIKLVLNKKDDYGSQSSLPNVDLTERRLRRAVSGRDPTTAAYVPETVYGILATNFTLGDQVIAMGLKDEYGVDRRPNPGAGEDTITSEAYVTVDLRMRVIVIPRS